VLPVSKRRSIAQTQEIRTEIQAAVAAVHNEATSTVNEVWPWVTMVLGLYAMERTASWLNKLMAWRRHTKLEEELGEALNGGSQ